MSKNWEMTFGAELELGDVRRDIILPEKFGDWDYCELDIVNELPPYRGVAADPLGEEPPVGGEIHIRPGRTPEELADTMAELLDFLRREGASFTAPVSSPFHVHIRTRGLRNDIVSLKKLVAFVESNQHFIFEKIWAFEKDPRMTPFCSRYLRTDGALAMPRWMSQNILNYAHNFNDFITLHCCGKDARSRGRPFRYGINLYCLKHIDTIEFRFFHATIDPEQALDCAEFCRRLLLYAFDDEGTAEDLYESLEWNFPPFRYDDELMKGWEKTRYPKSRCRPKVRKLVEDV